MHVGFDRFDGLLGMDRCDRRNNHSLQTLVFEHIVVGLVKCDPVRLQGRLRPLQFRIIGGTDGDQLCPRGAIEEMKGMPFSHSSKAGAANSKLDRSRWHLDDVVSPRSTHRT